MVLLWYNFSFNSFLESPTHCSSKLWYKLRLLYGTIHIKLELYLFKSFRVNNLSEDMVDSFYEAMLSSHKLKSGALKLLSYLKEKKYKLYITSNGYTEIQKKRIRDSKIEKYFDGIFISEEMDLRKPGKAFFNYVFNRIPESNLKNILMIGDAPTSDILGGINAGIDTCWVNNSDKNCKYTYTYKIKNLNELMTIL